MWNLILKPENTTCEHAFYANKKDFIFSTQWNLREKISTKEKGMSIIIIAIDYQ